jgi:DNA-binding response OmpR family regulator
MDITRVLVVHRHEEFAERLRDQIDSDQFAFEFTNHVAGLTERPVDEATDLIVVDLTALVSSQFALYRILDARSPLMPPLAVFRARAGERTAQRDGARWRIGARIETIESRLHAALGRTQRRLFWLPVTFAGTHLIANLPSTDVVVDGESVPLSVRESEVLGLLLTNCNRVVRREVLMSRIWGYDTRSLDVYVGRLRQKLGPAGRQLETVTSFGYRFVEPPRDPEAGETLSHGPVGVARDSRAAHGLSENTLAPRGGA